MIFIEQILLRDSIKQIPSSGFHYVESSLKQIPSSRFHRADSIAQILSSKFFRAESSLEQILSSRFHGAESSLIVLAHCTENTTPSRLHQTDFIEQIPSSRLSHIIVSGHCTMSTALGHIKS